MKKTILVCSSFYPPKFIGGAELIAHYQAKVLQKRGHEVIVFAGENAPERQRHSMRRYDYDGVPVFRVCLHPQDYQWDVINFFNPKIEWHFNTLLQAFSPDVAHLHNIIGLSTGIIHSAKRRGVKTVVTLHDHWGFCLKNTLLKRDNEVCTDYNRCFECLPLIGDSAQKSIPIRMRRDFLKLQMEEVDTFISPSLYLAKTYVRAGIPVGKIKVIWYGIDVARFSRVTKKDRSGRVRFTFIGYFGPHKGIDVLLDALALIPFRDRLEVNFVGEGHLKGDITQRVKALGLGQEVKFWGKIDNTRIEQVLRETDVQVLPSIWPENQPVTITEAMASRTPVIASAIGGIPELVRDGYNGYTFEPCSASDLATKMSEFIVHPERIEPFGENGFRMIEDKTFERQVDEICNVYG